HHALADDHRTYRHVAVNEGRLGLHEGDFHGGEVVGGGDGGFHGGPRVLRTSGSDVRGGGSGIRTHGEFPHTRSPGVPIRPLSHPSETLPQDGTDAASAACRG